MKTHLVVIEVEKTSQMFGLTITDNGNGQAFVKGKRANSILEHVDDILPGDAILSINGEGQYSFNLTILRLEIQP